MNVHIKINISLEGTIELLFQKITVFHIVMKFRYILFATKHIHNGWRMEKPLVKTG